MSGRIGAHSHSHSHCSLVPSPCFMRAALRVQALIGNAQPFHRAPAGQMLPHDLFGVLGLHTPVPDGVGIHHYRGPCSHWSRQPDLLMRTFAPSPASRASCCRRVCRSLLPSLVQEAAAHRRGAR